MDIETAFNRYADHLVGSAEEDDLRDLVQQVYVANEIEPTREMVDVAVVIFAAGIAYRAGRGMAVTMPDELANEFMTFLSQRGAT